MSNLVVCNSSIDMLNVVDLDEFKNIDNVPLSRNILERVGPCDICAFNDMVITANTFSDNISLVDIERKTVREYYIGVNCKGVKVDGESAYVLCGDSNSLIVFDIETRQIENFIYCGELPSGLDMNKRKGLIAVANMNEDSVSIISLKDGEKIRDIRVGSYPTSVVMTSDGNHLLVCESNLGRDSKGSISIVSLNSFQVINRIPVGKAPHNLFLSGQNVYNTNLADGSITVVDINKYELLSNIEIGGMPKNILKYEENLYVSDVYNNAIIKVNINTSKKVALPLRGEPSGMLLIR